MPVENTATPPRNHGRARLLASLVASVLAIVVVTVTVITISEPVVHGWNDTVGFTAGLITAVAAVVMVLRVGAPRTVHVRQH